MEYTIKLKLETKNKLKALGHKDQTYDEIVNSILDTKEYGENQWLLISFFVQYVIDNFQIIQTKNSFGVHEKFVEVRKWC